LTWKNIWKRRDIDLMQKNLPKLSSSDGVLDYRGGQGQVKRKPLKAPFPYFGGKRTIAALAWSRLGDVGNFIEPFAGSLAVLLLRPTPPRIETVNDLDCMVANFWRATQHDPEAVAAYADGPVNEADLHSRHRWLVLSDEARIFRWRMRRNPRYYNAKIAGWWCWGLCCWIGGGWCTEPGNNACGPSGSWSRTCNGGWRWRKNFGREG
jgi:hypothetical protein